MSNDLKKDMAKINDAAQEYLKVKVELLKVSLLAKLTNITASLINIWLISTFIIWILTIAAAGFIVWYGQTYNSYLTGFLLAGGFLILVLLLFIIFRKRIITNPVLRNYSEIIFDDDKDAEL
jgi:hypothetical protein